MQSLASVSVPDDLSSTQVLARATGEIPTPTSAQVPTPLSTRSLTVRSIHLRSHSEPTGLDQDQKAAGRVCVVHPNSPAKVAWDIISVLALLYNIVVVPYRICFDINSYCPQGLWILESTIDWIFVCDIMLNFVTAYEDPATGNHITDLRSISRHYATTWMPIDVCSSVPIDFFMSLAVDGCRFDATRGTANATPSAADEEGDLGGLRLLRVLRLVKLLKLIRILKLSALLDNLQDEFPIPNSLNILSKASFLLALTLYIGHILGCVFYAVSVVARDSGEDSWLDGLREPGGLTLSDGRAAGEAAGEGQGMVHLYVTCLYWAFTTMTTVGYGDISPVATGERIFTIFAMMVGSAVFGYIIGNTTSIIASSAAESAKRDELFANLNSYLKERKLPRELQVSIRKYFRYFYKIRGISNDEEHIVR